jgi:triosephosphate isomerase
MKRETFIFGNWKMNMTEGDTRNFLDRFLAAYSILMAKTPSTCRTAIFPPYTSIGECRRSCLRYYEEHAESSNSRIEYGAQNCHFEHNGAFTGEISLPMLLELECSWVLVGHSERRHVFLETDEGISRKVVACLDAGIRPVLCFGETLSERESGKTRDVVRRQIESVISSIAKHDWRRNLVLAYEPVWAIGTGRAATADDAQEICAYAAELLRMSRLFEETRIPILYGGSVSAGNARDLLCRNDIAGLLVGGASLKPESFLDILKVAVSS